MTSSIKRPVIGFNLFVAGAIIALTGFVNVANAEIDSEMLAGMEARAIGPATMSGRIADIDVVTSNTNIMYVGAASGGVWKSVNAGLTWVPVFDEQPVASIGAVAIYQANPDIVWVGTGEGNVRNSTSIGNGIYRTLDAGRTWQNMGLNKVERINRIAVHPTDPNIVYVAAMGQLWGENKERGIYKTIDGGKTWSNVLYVNEKTGGTDIKMDPNNPDKLFAAMWEFRRWPDFFKSGGEGSGLYMSRDGGDTWRQYTEEDGMPKGDLGNAAFAISPSETDVVYALVEAEKSAMLRSNDGGESWVTVNNETNISGRPFYYTEIQVDPVNSNRVYNIESKVTKSEDGGKNFERIAAINCCWAPNALHIDVHDMWINPNNARHIIVGNDGGLGISHDMGDTWRYVANLPLAQFYHINVDNDLPYNIYGGLQDNGSFRGPANVWENGGLRNSHWQEIGFGDGFEASPDPDDSMQGYSMSQGGSLSRWNLHTGAIQSIRPDNPNPDVVHRFNWSAGFAQDPFDSATIYYGSQYVHKSTDRGQSWTTLSEDLTTNNPDGQRQHNSGGLTLDVTAAENYTSITAIAASTVKEGVLWVGTDDGRVHVTQDGGNTWKSIEGRARGVSKGAWVPHIEASPHDASVAFILFDDHRRSDMKPHVYRVENYGRSWKNIITDDVTGYALSLQQDHVDPNLLFLGTEFGLFVTNTGGKNWLKWTAGVPTVSVMDIAIQERENDLILGTHGRAVFVLDDYSALRGLSAKKLDERLSLLSLAGGQQYVSKQSPGTRFDGSDGYRAPNEPRGVIITFAMSGDDLVHPNDKAERVRKAALRDKARGEDASDDSNDDSSDSEDEKLVITVTKPDGEHVRKFEVDVKQGVNRAVWDMGRDGNKRMPSDAPDNNHSGAEVPAGTYNITLKHGDNEVSGSVELLSDPRLSFTAAEVLERYETINYLGQLSDTAVDAVTRIVDARADVAILKGLASAAQKCSDKDAATSEECAGENAAEDQLKAFNDSADELNKKLDEMELRFRVLPDTKGLTDESKMVLNPIYRAMNYVGSYGGKPTKTAKIAINVAEKALADILVDFNALFDGDVKALADKKKELDLQLLTLSTGLSMPN
jgi:photosystem II stability/assembly factor-like uncharacterized protein